jgi:hypothetical protein
MRKRVLVPLILIFVVAAAWKGLVQSQTETVTGGAGSSDSAPPAISGAEGSALGRQAASEEKKSEANPNDLKTLKIFDEIIASRNDNDPRLDTEFRNLSPAAKAMLRDRYRNYQREKRNERGTVVFLLGRNLTSAEDMAFLREVLSEPPCRSMKDCEKDPANGEASSLHQDMGTEISLAYPQVVVLKSIEALFEKDGSDPQRLEEAKVILEAAKRSQSDKVRDLAGAIQHRLSSGE